MTLPHPIPFSPSFGPLDTVIRHPYSYIGRPRLPSPQIENKPAAIQAAAVNPAVVLKLEALMTEWCDQMEKLLNEAESPVGSGSGDESDGPRSELEHWRK